MAAKFDYSRIEGVQGNANVTPEFIEAVEQVADRLGTQPQYLLAAMSFETGGRFDPSIQNGIGATGLIQFLKSTAKNLGTTTDKLAKMSGVAQLAFVEKYFEPFKGRLGTLEAVYTSILSGSPKKPDAVLFKAGTPAYKLNPLDWNDDGIITAREATTPVAARMFGGIKAVQRRLLEVGAVPAAAKNGFADGRWGGNTTKALATFQKKNKLEETGLMDEATGLALFPPAAAATHASAAAATLPITAEGVPVSVALEKGSLSEAVGLLQDALVALGYMTLDQIGNFHGSFGPKTEAAVSAFQQNLGLTATGKFGDVESKALEDIQSGVAKGDTNTQVVKAIQTRLVELGLLTQKQVNTGPGIFGGQTEDAVKQFQTNHKLSASGVVEAKTFRALFNQIATSAPTPTSASGVFIAQDGEHFTVASSILMTADLQEKVANVANRYFAITGHGLIVTSGYRPPDRQSKAMFDKIVTEGETSVRNLYKNKALIDEILRTYRANKGNPTVAVAEMQKTIEEQMKRGRFISNHLLSNAIDVRKRTTNLASLKAAVSQVGGRVVVEGNHYHIELR
ncbi:MAG: peptidoglycan-binding protein [Acidobacteria bacterium]|nr:peptidoglycan-binding protein [Acidobacteriota bacterium]